tara:strand:- start:1444 stop:1704 length:261 start_codon:yes stop_codon:yes gene_type:complete
MNKVTNNEYQRIFELNSLANDGEASAKEKDELMYLLNKAGSLSKEDYASYVNGRDVDKILKYALIAAGVLLLVHALKEMFEGGGRP